jgi:hypothetical protein
MEDIDEILKKIRQTIASRTILKIKILNLHFVTITNIQCCAGCIFYNSTHSYYGLLRQGACQDEYAFNIQQLERHVIACNLTM